MEDNQTEIAQSPPSKRARCEPSQDDAPATPDPTTTAETFHVETFGPPLFDKRAFGLENPAYKGDYGSLVAPLFRAMTYATAAVTHFEAPDWWKSFSLEEFPFHLLLEKTEASARELCDYVYSHLLKLKQSELLEACNLQIKHPSTLPPVGMRGMNNLHRGCFSIAQIEQSESEWNESLADATIYTESAMRHKLLCQVLQQITFRLWPQSPQLTTVTDPFMPRRMVKALITHFGGAAWLQPVPGFPVPIDLFGAVDPERQCDGPNSVGVLQKRVDEWVPGELALTNFNVVHATVIPLKYCEFEDKLIKVFSDPVVYAGRLWLDELSEMQPAFYTESEWEKAVDLFVKLHRDLPADPDTIVRMIIFTIHNHLKKSQQRLVEILQPGPSRYDRRALPCSWNKVPKVDPPGLMIARGHSPTCERVWQLNFVRLAI